MSGALSENLLSSSFELLVEFCSCFPCLQNCWFLFSCYLSARVHSVLEAADLPYLCPPPYSKPAIMNFLHKGATSPSFLAFSIVEDIGSFKASADWIAGIVSLLIYSKFNKVWILILEARSYLNYNFLSQRER